MNWRVVYTETESADGVAPVCPKQTKAGGEHDKIEDRGFSQGRYDESGVYDCCPGPHLRVTEGCDPPAEATLLAKTMTLFGMEICD